MLDGPEGRGREVPDPNEHGGFVLVSRGMGDKGDGVLAGNGWGFGGVETRATADEVAEAGVPEGIYGRSGPGAWGGG